MNRRYLVIGLVACVALAVLAYASLPLVSASGAQQAGGGLTWSATVAEQLANAMDAAPPAISEKATIIGNPSGKGQTDFPVLREGSNGWICRPDSPDTPGNTPSCNDQVYEEWNAAFTAGQKPEVTKLGMRMMLAGGVSASEADPAVKAPASGKAWVMTPPQVQIVMPWDLRPADFSIDPAWGGPYIKWEGTPYEHLVMPVVMTKFQESDPNIRSAMSAAPLAVAKDATIMGPAPAGQTGLVELRKGTNGWTCMADPASTPAYDPRCFDKTYWAWRTALSARTAPPTTQIGLAYMLQGGSDGSYTDPLAPLPARPEDYYISPPHLMFIVPGGFSPADYNTNPGLGVPYIMYETNPYVHMMVHVPR